MSYYKDRPSGESAPRGKRERASYNPNFGSDNRLKSRPRFNRNGDERPQYQRTDSFGEGDFGRPRQQSAYKGRGYGNQSSERNYQGGNRWNRYPSDGKPAFRKGGYRPEPAEQAGGNWGESRTGQYSG